MPNYTGTDNLEIMAEAINYNRFLTEMILQQLAPGDCVVDFGAGIGTFARLIRDNGYSVYGIELDSAQREMMEQAGLRCAASLADLPHKDFSFAYSLNVLEHIHDDVATLRDLYYVLKPGGKLLVYVPAFMCLYTAMDRKIGHVRRYRYKELVERFQQAGFIVEEACYADSLGFLATIIYKLIGDKKGDLTIDSIKIYDRYLFPLSRLLDNFFSPLFGKNLLVIGSRKA